MRQGEGGSSEEKASPFKASSSGQVFEQAPGKTRLLSSTLRQGEEVTAADPELRRLWRFKLLSIQMFPSQVFLIRVLVFQKKPVTPVHSVPL